MLRGLYIAGLGMTTQMKRMDAVSNNIANADTTAFKRDGVATQSFTEALNKRLHDPAGYVDRHHINIGMVSNGVAVNDIFTDFSQGITSLTGNTFDTAISGGGFFTVIVENADGEVTEKYTRDGCFTLNSERYLMTKDGYLLMGQNGAVQIPDGEILFEKNGNIIVDGQLVDTLQLTDFENLESLRKFGSNLYDTTDESQPIPFSGDVLQGYIEGSNVNSIREMVEMITLSRVYEANQRVVTSIDSVLQKAVNDVGRK